MSQDEIFGWTKAGVLRQASELEAENERLRVELEAAFARFDLVKTERDRLAAELAKALSLGSKP